MAKMEYAEAKKIRGQSFASRMTDKLLGGEGVGSSLKSTISEKTKAKMTGIKETFDPMNIAKFMTGGSKLGAAIAGKALGRSQEDMQYFAGGGKRGASATKIDKLESDNSMVDMLMKIYTFMKDTSDNRKKNKEQENSKKEEIELEKERRHKELLKALGGKGGSERATAEKIQNDTGMGLGGILGSILGAFGGGMSALSMLANVGKFFVGPVGVALLGAASIGALFYAMAKASPEAHAEASKVQGAADVSSEGKAIMDVVEETTNVERRKQNILADRPKSKKSYLPWKDPDLQQKYLEEIGWDDTTGLTQKERDAGFTGIDEKGKPVKKTATEAPAAASTQAPSASAEPSQVSSTLNGGSPSAVATSGTPSTTTLEGGTTPSVPTTSAETTNNVGEKLNSVVSENLDMKVKEKTEEGVNVVNNSAIKKSMQSVDTKGPLPSVRNMEETFQRMILDSTRVV
jgi:hypothetical protein